MGLNGYLVAIDFSPGMLDHAWTRKEIYRFNDIEIKEENALQTSLPDGYADRAVVAFGLKTLTNELVARFAAELHRVLKPGGVVSFIEVSDPQRFLFRRLYLFYLKRIIPVLGRLFLGNPECYRMLGVYTERFQGCEPLIETIRDAGFEAKLVRYFYGCATGIVARKPG